MKILAVLVGVSTALPPGFHLNTIEVQQAMADFFAEYNRMAQLAAEAPDIHIYSRDPLTPEELAVQPKPVPLINSYSYTTNLGKQKQWAKPRF